MFEPEIVIAASPREWAQRLHRHIADHGGARLRATVLHAQETLDEQFDVFLADDTTSFLSHKLVDELHRRGRAVLGVYDADDDGGKGELVELGVDAVLERTASPDAFLAAIATLPDQRRGDEEFDRIVSGLRPEQAAGGEAMHSGGRLMAVGSPPGGCGATEVAIALAATAGCRQERAVLLDADETAPAAAQRLGVPQYPNLRTAVDAVEHHEGRLEDSLRLVAGAGFAVLPGLAGSRDWADVRPAELLGVVDRLLAMPLTVVANVGHSLEQLALSGPQRYALSRAVLGRADAIVGVGCPTPVGITRLLAWVVEVTAMAPATPVHLALNRAPASAFKRGEVTAELCRSLQPAGLHFLPEDGRVADAAWAGGVVAEGPFTRAVERMAASVLPLPPARRRRRRLAGRQ